MADRPIDEKIVTLTLENADFEKRAAESLNTFKQLNTDMSDVSKVDMSPIVNGISELNDKFSLTGTIVRKVYDNIANLVVNKGGALLRKMTFGGIMDGLDEYNEKINNTSIIMANTGLTGEKGIKTVGNALDELNTYADKTVYSFRDMTKNIGLFTAAGVGLKDSITAIKGLSNLSAQLGVGNAASARATYQLSQALGSGRINLQDWRSVETAGMSGKVFQKALWETGQEMNKVSIKYEELKKNGLSFRDTIKEKAKLKNGKNVGGWLTTDILQETLKKFATSEDDVAAARKALEGSKVYEKSNKGKDIKKLTKDEQKQLKLLQNEYDKTSRYFKKYGKTANEAATQYKTFSQLRDAFFEGLGSMWSGVWQNILGDLHEAKKLWTAVGDQIVEPINKVANSIGSIFKLWHDMGGRKKLLEGISLIWDAIKEVLKPLGTFFSQVFPTSVDESANKLMSISEGVVAFGKGLKKVLTPIGSGLNELAKIVAVPLKAAFDVIGKVVLSVTKIFAALFTPIGELIGIFGQIIRLATELGSKIVDSIFGTSISSAINSLSSGLNSIIDVIQTVSETFRFFLEGVRSGLSNFHIGDGFSSLADNIRNFFVGNTNTKGKDKGKDKDKDKDKDKGKDKGKGKGKEDTTEDEMSIGRAAANKLLSWLPDTELTRKISNFFNGVREDSKNTSEAITTDSNKTKQNITTDSKGTKDAVTTDSKNTKDTVTANSKETKDKITANSKETKDSITQDAKNTSQTITDESKKTAEETQNAGERMGAGLRNGFDKIFNGIKKAWDSMKDYILTGGLDADMANVSKTFDGISANIQGFFTEAFKGFDLKKILKDAYTEAKTFARELKKAHPALKPVISALRTIKNGLKTVYNMVKPLTDAISKEVNARWIKFKDTVKGIVDIFKSAPSISQGFDSIAKLYPELEKPATALYKITKDIETGFSKSKNSIKQYVTDVKTRLEMVKPAMEKSHDFKTIISAWKEAIMGPYTLEDVVRKVAKNIEGIFKDIGKYVSTFAKAILPEKTYNAIASTLNKIKQAIKSTGIPALIKKYINIDNVIATFKALNPKQLFSNIINFDWSLLFENLKKLDFKAMWAQISETNIGGIIDSIANAINNLGKALSNNKVDSQFKKIETSVSGTVDTLKSGEKAVKAITSFLGTNKTPEEKLTASLTTGSGTNGNLLSASVGGATGSLVKNKGTAKGSKNDLKTATQATAEANESTVELTGFLKQFDDFLGSDVGKLASEAAIKIIPFVGAIKMIKQFGKQAKELAETSKPDSPLAALVGLEIGPGLKSIGMGLKSIGGGVTAIGKAVRTFGIAKIFAAIAPMLDTLLEFAKLNDEQLNRASKAALGLAAFIGFLNVAIWLGKRSAKNMVALAIYFAGVAILVDRLTYACTIAGKLKNKDLIRLGAALVIGAAMVWELSKVSEGISDSAGRAFIGLSVAIFAMGIVIKSLSKLNDAQMQQGLTGLFGMMTFMVTGMIILTALGKIGYIDASVGRAMLSLAGSILMLTVAFTALTLVMAIVVRSKSLMQAAGLAIIVILAVLATLVVAVNAMNTQNLERAGITLLALAASLVILTGAALGFYVVGLIASKHIGAMILGLIVMGVALAGLIVAVNSINIQGIAGCGLAMLALAAALTLMLIPITVISLLWWALIPGMLAVGAFMLLLTAFAFAAQNSKMKESVVGFASLAVAFGAMALALEFLKDIPFEIILSALGGFSLVIYALAALSNAMEDLNPLSLMFTLVTLAASFVVVSVGLMLIANVPWQTIVAGLGMFSVALVALAVAAKVIQKTDGIGKLAIQMIALGVAFVIFAAGLSLINNANPWVVIAALGGFAAVAAVMGLVGSAMSAGALGMFAFAAAALAVGFAVSAITGLLQLFGVGAESTSTKMVSFGNTATSVGNAFGGFGSIVSGVVQFLGTIFSGFASVLSVVGGAISNIMSALSNSILGSLGSWVTGAIEKGGQFLGTLKNTFLSARQNATQQTSATATEVGNTLNTLPQTAKTAGDKYKKTVTDHFKKTKDDANKTTKEMSKDVKNELDDMAASGTQPVQSMWDRFNSIMSSEGSTATKGLKNTKNDMLAVFNSFSTDGKSSGSDFMKGLTSGLTTGGGKAKTSVTNLKNEISKSISGLGKDGSSAGTEFMTSLTGSIKNNSDKPKKEAKKAAEGAKKEVKNEWTGLNLGKLLTDGCIKGLNSEKVKKYARELAAKALEAMRKKLDVNSPSKATMRIFQSVGEGAILGMDKTANDVARSGRELAARTLEAIDDAMNEQDDLRYEPIIAPILDLDEMQSIRDTIASIPVRTGFRGIQNGSTSNKTNIKGINVQVNIRSTDGKSAQDIASIARKQAEEVITKEVRKINWR